MAMFRVTPNPVNLDRSIQLTIDWLDRRARTGSTQSGGALPLMFRWGFCLWPARCLICRRAADLRYLDLCCDCLWTFPFSASSVAAREMLPLSYAPPVDEGLRALKFHADWRWAAVFGALLAGWSQAIGVAPVSLLIPMPLHTDRRAERGFNQAAQIARFAAIWLGIPVDERALVRTRATQPQTTLSAAERRNNVSNAFEVHPSVRRRLTAPTSVALIDDVRTTGATLRAASETLESVSGLLVQRWAVASTMPTNTARPA
jgi:ComF family protein